MTRLACWFNVFLFVRAREHSLRFIYFCFTTELLPTPLSRMWCEQLYSIYTTTVLQAKECELVDFPAFGGIEKAVFAFIVWRYSCLKGVRKVKLVSLALCVCVIVFEFVIAKVMVTINRVGV